MSTFVNSEDQDVAFHQDLHCLANRTALSHLVASAGGSSVVFIFQRKHMLWVLKRTVSHVQADLRLCWSHILHCWKSHALA